MESFFARFKNALVLIVLLLVQVFALAVQVRRPADPHSPDGPEVRLLRVWTMTALSPFERAATTSGHALRAAWANYVALRHVRDENAELHRELADLRLQRAALAQKSLARAGRFSWEENVRQTVEVYRLAAAEKS